MLSGSSWLRRGIGSGLIYGAERSGRKPSDQRSITEHEHYQFWNNSSDISMFWFWYNMDSWQFPDGMVLILVAHAHLDSVADPGFSQRRAPTLSLGRRDTNLLNFPSKTPWNREKNWSREGMPGAPHLWSATATEYYSYRLGNKHERWSSRPGMRPIVSCPPVPLFRHIVSRPPVPLFRHIVSRPPVPLFRHIVSRPPVPLFRHIVPSFLACHSLTECVPKIASQIVMIFAQDRKWKYLDESGLFMTLWDQHGHDIFPLIPVNHHHSIMCPTHLVKYVLHDKSPAQGFRDQGSWRAGDQEFLGFFF